MAAEMKSKEIKNSSEASEDGSELMGSQRSLRNGSIDNSASEHSHWSGFHEKLKYLGIRRSQPHSDSLPDVSSRKDDCEPLGGETGGKVCDSIKINIAKDFSPTPGGRHKNLSPWSGEEFCDKIASYLVRGIRVEITLDGTEGYGASFLEEAFGGLARKKIWSLKELKGLVIIKADLPAYQSYVDLAYKYMAAAFTKASNQEV